MFILDKILQNKANLKKNKKWPPHVKFIKTDKMQIFQK